MWKPGARRYTILALPVFASLVVLEHSAGRTWPAILARSIVGPVMIILGGVGARRSAWIAVFIVGAIVWAFTGGWVATVVYSVLAGLTLVLPAPPEEPARASRG